MRPREDVLVMWRWAWKWVSYLFEGNSEKIRVGYDTVSLYTEKQVNDKNSLYN